MNYYEVLQISESASEEVIRAAYKSLAKKYHPDKGEGADSRKFIEIEEAYEVLSDKEKRKVYDEKLSYKKEIEKKETREKSEVSIKQEDKSVKISPVKKLKKRLSDIFETIFSILIWGFIIYSWFGNAEKIKMDLLNKVNIQTFSTSGTEYEVGFVFEYEDSWFNADPDVWINIDGERHRLVTEGDGAVFEQKLTEGEHIVFIETKTLHINSKKQKITVSGNDEMYYFEIKGRKVFGAEMYHIY